MANALFGKGFLNNKKNIKKFKKTIAKKNLSIIVGKDFGYGCVAQLARATDS